MRRTFFNFMIFLCCFRLSAQNQTQSSAIEYKKLATDLQFRNCPDIRTDTISGKEISFIDTTFTKGEMDSHILKQKSNYGKWSIMMYVDESRNNGTFIDHDSIFFKLNGINVPCAIQQIPRYYTDSITLHDFFYNPYRMNKKPAVLYTSAKQKLLKVPCWSTVTTGAGMGSEIYLLFDVTIPDKPKLTLVYFYAGSYDWNVSDVDCDGIFDLVKWETIDYTMSEKKAKFEGLIPINPDSFDFHINSYEYWIFYSSADGINWLPVKDKNNQPYDVIAITYTERVEHSTAVVLRRNWPY